MAMSHALSIGQLSKVTHCKVPTIRYYEQIGLMPPPSRTAGNQRRYGPEHVARLAFIQHCRELGFRQNAIRDLLRLTEQPNQSCEAVTEIARAHLDQINQRIARLAALKSELERMIGVCRGGQIADCRIIETIADHSPAHRLMSDHH
jgi:DNA-binding transcriptional MerR regulator